MTADKNTTPRRSAVARVAEVRLTHPDKVLWPDDGLTKLDLARYYAALAPTILQYIRDCPLTLRPFPGGITQAGFYRKEVPRGAPKWIETFQDVAESTGEPIDFVVATERRTIVWLAQYNAIEIHAWLSTVHHPDCPRWAVVDLDPPDDLPDEARRRALAAAGTAVRAGLETRGLQGFPKLSGQAGLHVLVPLEPLHPFDEVRAFFEALSVDLCRRHGDLLTTEYSIAARQGRILIDYAQNARGKTTVAPYSARPKPGAPVSVPLDWKEAADSQALARRWTIRTVPARLEAQGDPLAPALELTQRLGAPAQRR